MLGLKFAYATNGRTIIEFSFITGKESELKAFPSPDDLWKQLCAAEKITEHVADKVLSPCNYQAWKELRYYKEIAIISDRFSGFAHCFRNSAEFG